MTTVVRFSALYLKQRKIGLACGVAVAALGLWQVLRGTTGALGVANFGLWSLFALLSVLWLVRAARGAVWSDGAVNHFFLNPFHARTSPADAVLHCAVEGKRVVITEGGQGGRALLKMPAWALHTEDVQALLTTQGQPQSADLRALEQGPQSNHLHLPVLIAIAVGLVIVMAVVAAVLATAKARTPADPLAAKLAELEARSAALRAGILDGASTGTRSTDPGGAVEAKRRARSLVPAALERPCSQADFSRILAKIVSQSESDDEWTQFRYQQADVFDAAWQDELLRTIGAFADDRDGRSGREAVVNHIVANHERQAPTKSVAERRQWLERLYASFDRQQDPQVRYQFGWIVRQLAHGDEEALFLDGYRRFLDDPDRQVWQAAYFGLVVDAPQHALDFTSARILALDPQQPRDQERLKFLTGVMPDMGGDFYALLEKAGKGDRAREVRAKLK